MHKRISMAEEQVMVHFAKLTDGSFDICLDSDRPENGSSITLAEWMERMYEEKAGSGQSKSNAMSYRHALRHIIDYKGGDVMLTDVDTAFCTGFITYLSTARCYACKKEKQRSKCLSPSSARLYFLTFATAINAAVRGGYLRTNPIQRIESNRHSIIRPSASTRTFLSIYELKSMIATPCGNEAVKRTFVFACYCGMRISDIRSLRWCEVTDYGNGIVCICKTMVKTRTQIILPLSRKAQEWLPERGNASDDSLVFNDIPATSTISHELKLWAATAGVKKNICFHVSRHTFATTALALGVELYTLSKLLGHSSIQTTQIYGEIVNEKKIAAVNLFDKL